jgi:hypothetical protein
MSIVFCGIHALTVALIFYSWRDYHERLIGRHQQLRDRVAYMLWVMAKGAAD